MSLKIYNTLTRKKEDFITREKNQVQMYVCGPTVYNFIHIGNARCYIVFDMIKRYFRYLGYKVKCVQNFTDVDDKIINRSKEEGISCEEVSEKYTRAFLEDMENLGVEPAEVYPKATEHIREMQEIIAGLINKGFAYVVDGDVYFEVDKFKGYGKLSGRTKEEMRAGERVEVSERKKNPLDFALWKKAKEGEPWWDSPWGKGRPGWHIECSAMSLKYLGMGFDIHGGGMDLIFPHHENEIAQSEAYLSEEPFVRYWLHNGLLTFREEKMAKSVGNIVLLRDLLKQWHPNALKLFYLSTHYRSPIDFTFEKMVEATKAWERLEITLDNINFILTRGRFEALPEKERTKGLEKAIKRTEDKFKKAMDDDFNTPRALSAIFELAREVNTFIDENQSRLVIEDKKVLKEARDKILNLSGVLGLKLMQPLSILPDLVRKLRGYYLELVGSESEESLNLEEVLDCILSLREEARKEKDWERADQIRRRLKEFGVEIEDTPFGPRWRFPLAK